VGLTCVITGATSGLGRATALALADRGADLFLIGRNEDAGERVARLCRGRLKDSRATFLRADLCSLADVRNAAAAIASERDRIDVLVNNAGARYDTYAESADGIERTFAGNHLGHFLLTHLLLSRLAAATPGRVITIGSQAHTGADLTNGWIASAAHYNRRVAYANSKLANIVFARELAARHDRAITSNAVDPGIVLSRFARNNGLQSWLKHVVAHGLRRELVPAAAAADTIVYLAADQAMRKSTGGYFFQRREISPSPLAADTEVGRQLWELSLTLTDLPSSVDPHN
jgi:NAD(P)-dependent dehydrogenase (short-subunit alcohol dehydrogenase family)